MRIWREEIFGPVLAATTFKTEEEAIQLANDSEFGLAGAVISADEQVQLLQSAFLTVTSRRIANRVSTSHKTNQGRSALRQLGILKTKSIPPVGFYGSATMC